MLLSCYIPYIYKYSAKLLKILIIRKIFELN